MGCMEGSSYGSGTVREIGARSGRVKKRSLRGDGRGVLARSRVVPQSRHYVSGMTMQLSVFVELRSKLCFILAYFSSPKTQVIWVIPRWKIGPSSQRGSPSLTDRGFNGPRDTYYSSTPLEDATA